MYQQYLIYVTLWVMFNGSVPFSFVDKIYSEDDLLDYNDDYFSEIYVINLSEYSDKVINQLDDLRRHRYVITDFMDRLLAG